MLLIHVIAEPSYIPCGIKSVCHHHMLRLLFISFQFESKYDTFFFKFKNSFKNLLVNFFLIDSKQYLVLIATIFC